MTRFYKIIEHLYEKKIDASGLAITRIIYSMVLLCEVIQLYYFRHLIYDKIPLVEPSDMDPSLSLILWMISIMFIMFGLFTKQAAIVNYIFTIVFFSAIRSYEYHMFYVYLAVNFLLMFVNVSQTGSLDRLRQKLKYSNTRFTYNPTRNVSVLNYHILVLVSIAFVYFDSFLFKLASYNWVHGLGMWLPASLPFAVRTNGSFLLNIKWIAFLLGYLTFVFEAVFLFTFFRKGWRIVLLTIGIGLHIGIAIIFPLPWFGLGVCGLYLLMVPVSFWKKIRNWACFKHPKLFFFYDEECPLCIRTKIILQHFDWLGAIEFKGVQTFGFNDNRLKHIDKEKLLDNIYSITAKGKIFSGIDTYREAFKLTPAFTIFGYLLYLPGISHIAKWIYAKVALNRTVERCTEDNCGYIPPKSPINIDSIKLLKNFSVKQLKLISISYGVLILFFLQFNASYNSDVVSLIKRRLHVENSRPVIMLNSLSRKIKKFTVHTLGISNHALFMDSHFLNYNHEVAVEAKFTNGNKIWLPIINPDGKPGKYLTGPTWAKWTFRVTSPKINQQKLRTGIRDFATFWAGKNNVPLNQVKFNIYVKKIDVPLTWKYNHLNEQLSHRWEQVGVMYWEGDDFISNIPQIESL